MQSKMRMEWVAGAASLALLAAASPAFAQASDPSVQANTTASDEILITARKRAESLQDVPASVTAFTAGAIEAAGIERPIDFINLTSNVQLIEVQNAGNAFVIIRGITQNRNSEPSVAVIVDGVQQVSAAQFSQELFDIEQIEVLKGPQGGLYGRNAIGGAIVINTKQPTDEFEGRIKVAVDNGPGVTVRAGVSGPITDDLHFRVAGSFVDTDGYIENTFLGEEADPFQDLSFRGLLLWEPTTNFTADLRGYTGRLRTQGLYYNIVSDVNDTSLPVRVNNAGQNDRDTWGASLKLTLDTSLGSLTSISAYDSLEEILTGDAFDFLPIEDSFFQSIFGFDLNQSQFLDVGAWSQEIRFTSPAERRVRYIVGSYLIGTDRYISTGNMVDTGNGVFPVFRTPSTNALNPQATFLADEQNNFAWAVFGNLSVSVTKKLELDLSLRYDRDNRENTTLTPTAFLPNVPGFPQGQTGEVREESFDSLQPKATLTYKINDDINIYGGYSEGFRSGGFNQTGVGAVAAGNGIVGVTDIFQAEEARTIEGGIKTQLLDRALTLNAAAYRTISENSYFFVFLAANSTQNLGNVPEVELIGFEIDGAARLSDRLRLTYGLGYTFSEIKAFQDPSVIGNDAPGVSRSTVNIGADYLQPIGGNWDLRIHAEYRRTGPTFFDLPNSTVRDPVDLVGLRVGFESPNWIITAFSENLFNEEYNTEFSPGGFVFKARPRVFGLELSRQF